MTSTIQQQFKIKEELTLGVGRAAPDFQLQTETGEYWRLSAQRGRIVVLLIYPKDETFVCTRQMCSLRDNWEHYARTGAMIVGVSPGTAGDHKSFSEHHSLPIPLLADVERRVTDTYSTHWFYPPYFMRTVVVIDAKGVIRKRDVMLRTFRPTDNSVIASIYSARAEESSDRYPTLGKSRMSYYRV
jgi:peroxiredoxin Q/BCP